MGGRSQQDASKLQASANRSRDLANSMQRLSSSSGLPLGDVGATKVVITKAVIDGLGRTCDGYGISGGLVGAPFTNERCDGVVNKGDVTTMIMTADGLRIQALATGSAAGGGGDTNITNIIFDTFSAD